MDFYYSVEEVFDIYMRAVWMMFFLGHTAFRDYIPSIQSLTLYILLASIAMYFIKIVLENEMNIARELIPRVTIIYSFFALDVFLSRRYGVMVESSPDMLKYICKFNLLAVLAMDIFTVSRKRMDELLKLYLVSMTITAVVITVTTPVSLWGNENGYGGITNIHRNTASLIYVIAFCIALYFIESTKRIPYIGIAFVLFMANLITGSRKGIIQILFAFAIFLLVHGKIKLKVKYIFYLILTLGMVILAYIYIPWFRDTFGERMLAIFDDSIEDTSKYYRTLYRTLAFYAFLDHPVFGYGYEAFPLINEFITGLRLYSHCNFTELLCNYGIVGFSLYYVNYAISLVKALVHRKDPIAKFIFYTVIPLILIEYGQIDYSISAGAYAVLITLTSAKVLTPRFQGV
ncbi:O-antigen ligase family protein [Butyrivibrio sp. WCD3002]|uniref:O-antigen ligase family protein n=1 Tax=Butyrivibrio sp. WCD3002 TaxID=1280676 RepID=UPI000479F551|nr:O-antigen ligase family protein [Butyrivibrio sp. WCD3002]